MITTLINVLLPILMTFLSPSTSGTTKDEISTVTLRRISIPNPALCKILDEVTDSVRFGGSQAFYSLSAEPYHDGVMVRIERYDSDLFEKRQYPFAYTIVNDRMIVLNHMRGLTFNDVSNAETMTVKTAKMDNRQDISDIFFYYILDDLYARYSPEAGWLWSDGLPDI